MPDSTSDVHGVGRGDREQLRLAVVLNGGVSLAIWMGGACHEIDRLTRRHGAYATLLDWAGSDARVDVISGTSAGGINGAALALSQANETSQGLGMLRDVWLESGSFARLLRQPFRGSPSSLLQGDEYFLRELNRAFHGLAQPYTPASVATSPIDLTITATLLRGVPGVTVDSAGQRILQKRHDGLFRFQRGSTHRDGETQDDFSADRVKADSDGVLDALALAARTTASYPVAFEPSYVPTTDDQVQAFADRRHPNMGTHLDGAWDRQQGAYARYAVDGGVLANTPTRPALAAIDAMPAEGLVRRVLLLVHPHAPAPQQDTHDRADEAPTLTAVGGSILGALTSEGSRNYVDLIEQHNRVAGGRREMRADVVRLPHQPARTVDSPWRTRDQSAGGAGRRARLPAHGWRRCPQPPPGRLGEPTRMSQQPDGAPEASLAVQARLSYPWYRVLRTRRVARDLAQWWVDRPAASQTESVPHTYRQVMDLLQANDTWMPTLDQDGAGLPDPHLLGFEGAMGVADAAVDYLRRAIWQAATPGAKGTPMQDIRAARRQVSAVRNELVNARVAFMTAAQASAASSTALTTWVQQLLDDYASAERRKTFAGLLARIAEQVSAVHVPVPPGDTSADAEVLRGFINALGSGHAAPADTLTRLNQVQMLTYVLSDEMTTGNSLPIDLVQLSYQVTHPFASTHSGEEKVAGDTLSRFSAFLKRSWRVNDWAWGRLDAAATLCRLVLEPSRVQRYIDAQRLPSPPERSTPSAPAGTAPAEREPFKQAAERLVDDLMAGMPRLPGLPTTRQVLDEVWTLDPGGSHDSGRDSSDSPAPGVLRHLPLVFAALLACEVAADEMPELVRAVNQDDLEGANPRARGSVAVKANHQTLTNAGTGDVAARWAALDVFATAGIGTETPGSESSSDQLITTATNAAGAGITLLNSPRAGLTFLSPVTRALRGAALLPYWTITGLTTTGILARGLALVAMAAGATLLTLGLLGVGPAWGIAVGAAAVLGGFAYGALRTGTVLHGTVLLLPALVLLSWAAQVSTPDQTADAAGETAGGAATPLGILLAVVLLIGGLILLGSLRPPMRSPLALIAGSQKSTGSRALRAARVVGVVLILVGVVAVLAVLLTPVVRDGLANVLDAVLDWFAALPPAVRSAAVAALAVLALAWIAGGGWVAYQTGVGWRMLVLEVRPEPDESGQPAAQHSRHDLTPRREWTTRPVEHPAATAIGWSWVYGMAGAATAFLVLAWFGFTWPQDPWARAALIGLTAGALVLLLPVPWWLARTQSRRLHTQLVDLFARLPESACTRDKTQALFSSGLDYHRVLTVPAGPVASDTVWDGPTLTEAARRAWDEAHRPPASPQPSAQTPDVAGPAQPPRTT